MYLRKTILLLSVLHVSVAVYAQEPCTAVFSGQILDENNQPVIGAGILIIPEQIGQSTNVEGKFQFSNLCNGKYKVRVQYLGYQDVELNLSVNGDVEREIHMKELVTQLEEVVIHHHDEAHTENATNFVQLSERQLAESAGKSLGESLRAVSGVNTIQTGPGIFKPVIHGVHSQRILILNHGLRQEGQQWGAEHAPEIDPFIASNIVVIKDASAIKYGTDALGGVIVVNPPALPEKANLGGTLNSVVQSNGRSGTFSGMLEGGIKKHNGWGWRMQGTLKQTGDFHTADYNLTNSGIKEANFSVATGYHKKKMGFDIFASRFQTEIGILKGTSTETKDDLFAAMERTVPAYTTNFSYSISEPRQEVSHNLLKLNGHLQLKNGEWRWQYGFQNNNRKEFDLRIGSLSKIPAIDLQLNTHSFDTEWETKHSEKRTLTFGANGTYQQNKNIPGTQRIPFIPNFNTLSSGVFGIAKLFLGTWTVDLGARYDYRQYEAKGFDFKNSFYSTTFQFNNFSASSGATKHLGAEQTLNMNLSSSWRPPHVAELYSLGKHQSAAAIEYGLMLNDTTNEVMDINEVNFNTEQALKFVASYQLRNDKFSFDVGPYANYIFNYIYLRAGGITQNVRGVYPYFRYNQTDALFLGADLSVNWHAAKYFSINPQASLLRASDELHHDYFVFTPSNRYALAFRYERPAFLKFKNVYVASRADYVTRQNRAPRVITAREIDEARESNTDPFENDKRNFDFMEAPPAYWLLNLSAGVSLPTKKVQYDFRISSDNTLNRKYREYTNRFRYYADDLGRNIIVSFKCIF
jgi:iron complex outermembrane recepter protein